MLGEDPFFRQLPAGDTGDGGRHSSRGVVGTESTPSARHPVPGRRDRRRIGVLKRT